MTKKIIIDRKKRERHTEMSLIMPTLTL